MEFNKALIIAAHPDDDILGCGGFLSKFGKDKDIRVVFIAEGTSCRFSSSEINEKKEEISNEIKHRNSCGKKALSYLGVKDCEFYNFACGRLDQIPLIDINKIIENEISEFKPDIILTHSKKDLNSDHKIIFSSVLTATRPVRKSKVKSIFSFEVLSSSEWNFSKSFAPNYFLELSREDIDKKWAALSMYDTEVKEFPHPRSKEGIDTLAKYRGLQSGVPFAEAFKLIRSLP